VKSTSALVLLLAAAALVPGAVVAGASTPPPARGGHALTVVYATEPAPAVPPAQPAPVPIEIPAPAEPIIISDSIATPTFTVVQTGNTVTVDASASVCHNGGCDFSWRLYSEDGNRLGATMGFGALLTYTLPAAGIYQIVLTKSEYCVAGGGSSLRSCPRTAQQTVTAV
jgi:hypothetical protein